MPISAERFLIPKLSASNRV